MLRKPRPSKRGTTRRPPTANCWEIYYILYVSDRINDTAIDVERSLRQFKRRMHAGRRISLRRITLRAAAAAAVAVILLAGALPPCRFPNALRSPDRHHPSGRTFAGGAA